MSRRTNAIGADSGFYEDATKLVKVCKGLIHGIKQVCIMLKASRIIRKIEKDCEALDHSVRD